ncbi:MAG: zinc-ribbon and DUF3426 domain-containing protein [Burkholderiales bacterium]|nr:zinc-ribbon and DUF3426 domain-containing protein [Burkholderiales bacterium]
MASSNAMSLATRCTHCGTIFKVVQDQLKVSEGWVRCGRCNSVFNAMPGLFDLERDLPPQRTQTAPSQPAAGDAIVVDSPEPGETSSSEWPSTSPTMQQAAPDAVTDFELDTFVSADDDAPPAFPPSQLPVTDESDALDSRYLVSTRTERRPPRRRPGGPDFADAEFPNDAVHEAPDEWDSGLDSMPYSEEPTPPQIAAPPDRPAMARPQEGTEPDRGEAHKLPAAPDENFVPEQALKPPSQRRGRPGTRGQDPASKTPEFLRRAQRRAFWHHPAMRTLLSVLILGLLLTLTLQIGHQFRNLLAAHHPALKPYLEQWCQAMDCRIEPPLRIDSLQVESATLVRTSSEGPDTYRLTVVVHNRAPIGLAWPHLDLALTDTNGVVVARRAFSPRDAQWLANADSANGPASVAAPGGPLPDAVPSQRSTTMQWRLRAADLKLAGYTAELFYP